MGREGFDERVLSQARDAIDDIDEELLALVARRRELVRRLWQLKLGAGEPIRDRAREAAILTDASSRARAIGLGREAVRHLFEALLAAMHDEPPSDGGSLSP